MKTIIAFLILASTISMVSCEKTEGQKNALKLLEIVNELYPSFSNTRNFINAVGLTGNETGDRGGNDTQSHEIGLVKYCPESGDNRVVVRVSDNYDFSSDGDVDFWGLDMSGFHDVLKDLDSKTNSEKKMAIETFVSNSIVDRLDKVGFGKDAEYIEQGSGNVFSEFGQTFKDLESLGARMEMSSSKEFGEKLVADYGLSEERAQKVARTINAYQRLTSKRSLTRREQNAYSQELLGVDYKKAEKAIMQGDDFDQLMEDAAEKNGTSPEQVSAIIRDMIL